ncbi:MAG TPA: tRNA pseudouridine(38-40) synthase TruA [Phycisphaerae bacterium]|jgi:tRNA pseudouridine38-40 synthase|nr:tRNA pseudouridine(38-40) synthase TruA [Phycisphaerae bacterium]
MERHFKIVLAYDGTDFHGWQRQAGVRTVQEDVEGVLQRVLRHPLHVDGASRTDAGVHARGQVACFLTTAPLPDANLARAIAHHLPADVALLHLAAVPAEFHPSRDARSKLYRYRIYQTPQRPVAELVSRYAWHVWCPLDLDRVRAAAATLVGTHDFAAFASQGSPRASTVRRVRRIEIARRFHEVWIDVEGDGFLYNQVRNMVGTLVEVGRGHWPPERVPEILAGRERSAAGPTAPPHGLCLQWVRYGPPGATPDGID